MRNFILSIAPFLLAATLPTLAFAQDRTTLAASPATTGVAYRGVSTAMWAEINAQRSSFGDTNDCQARVNAIPTSGGVTLQPGADINAALKANSLVFLSGGTYKLAGTIKLETGRKLIGVSGQTVTIDASAVEQAVWIRGNAVLANVSIRDAIDIGLNFVGPSAGSSNALAYQVSVGRTGLSATPNDGGIGIMITQGASANCVVSTEVFDSWNEVGQSATTANGGNADGYYVSYGAHRNTLIDSHSYRNGDDGFDTWEGGVAYFYFCSAFDMGKTTGKTITGDGNGFKLGRGNVRHYLYKTRAYRNKSHGFNMNGNSVAPVLVESDAFANGEVDFQGIDR
jgi:hypothetical protein